MRRAQRPPPATRITGGTSPRNRPWRSRCLAARPPRNDPLVRHPARSRTGRAARLPHQPGLGSWAEMSTPSLPVPLSSHRAGRPAAIAFARNEPTELKYLSVRELIAALAQLEQASRSPSWIFSNIQGHSDWPRLLTQEERVIAELRRHAELGRWRLPDSEAAGDRGGDPPPDGAARTLHGQGTRRVPSGEEKSCPA